MLYVISSFSILLYYKYVVLSLKLWIPIPKGTAKWNHAPTCEKCTYLYCYARRKTNTKTAITPTPKGKHLQPPTFYSLTHKYEKRPASKQKNFDMHKKTEGTGFDMNVGEGTRSKPVALVSKIQQQSHLEIDQSEADRTGKGETLRQKWNRMWKTGLLFQEIRVGMVCVVKCSFIATKARKLMWRFC